MLVNLEELYTLILKGGVKKYKVKNSQYHPLDYQEPDGKKGAVFGFRTKEHMMNAKGIVFSSVEGLLENTKKLTHWTPNVFSWGGYADREGTVVRGHFEKNLQQVNTFVLDIDGHKDVMDHKDIIVAGAEVGLIPTLILETPKGYQVYFVLDKASYISKVNDYKSLRTAKAIARSIKIAFASELPGVDLGCNSLGIFRLPTKQNIRAYHPDSTHSFVDLMKWSMSIAQEHVTENHSAKVVKEQPKQIDAAWFKNLLNTTEVKGERGVFGRNSAIFTAALACYSSKKTEEEAMNLLDEFNTYLAAPLSFKEVKKVVLSAYSGRYQGASKAYIDALCDTWAIQQNGFSSASGKVWVKFAKPRKERVRSHYKEWKKDLLRYVNGRTKQYKPYVQVTMSEIKTAIGIPLSTLKELIKQLVAQQVLFVETKKGKNGYTKMATAKSMAITLVKQKQVLFQHYQGVLERYFPVSTYVSSKVKNKGLKSEIPGFSTVFSEVNTS